MPKYWSKFYPYGQISPRENGITQNYVRNLIYTTLPRYIVKILLMNFHTYLPTYLPKTCQPLPWNFQSLFHVSFPGALPARGSHIQKNSSASIYLLPRSLIERKGNFDSFCDTLDKAYLEVSSFIAKPKDNWWWLYNFIRRTNKPLVQ